VVATHSQAYSVIGITKPERSMIPQASLIYVIAGVNTLAYYNTAIIMTLKSFILHASAGGL